MAQAEPKLDDADRRIINRIQSDFPITSRPYQEIARELDITEEEVLERVGKLKAAGIIRRIGGNFVPGRLGYVSTLCAARVPADKIELFASTVNQYSGVTHNYLRENPYNVWFTFIAPSRTEIEEHLADIARETGIDDILNLPATHVFKIKAEFKV
jgi:DNA-binding Lrp family transcriptional regulator